MASAMNTIVGIEALSKWLQQLVLPAPDPERHLARVCNVQTYATKQERFDQAVRYAQVKMLDPVDKQFYSIMARRMKCTHAYHAAVRDYMKDPEIGRIELSGYAGEKRDRIFIESPDYFKIAVMIVEIVSADGTLVESGTAVRKRDEKRWKYLTQTSNAAWAGTCVKAIAIDRPGKEVVREEIM